MCCECAALPIQCLFKCILLHFCLKAKKIWQTSEWNSSVVTAQGSMVVKHNGYQRLMTPKHLILQIFFLNFVRHFGFPWCTFDLKTLLVLFNGDFRCFTYSCVLHTGDYNTGKYLGSVGTNSTNSFIPEAWFMVAASSGKSQGYKDFLNVREYTSLKEVWKNLK